MCLDHQCSQSIRVTAGVTVMLLPSSALQKIIGATDCLCQIALNQKLFCKFEKWCTFQVTLNENHTKRAGIKGDLPV